MECCLDLVASSYRDVKLSIELKVREDNKNPFINWNTYQ